MFKWIAAAIFGALLFAVQIAMAGLPNIELVTTLLLVFACVYRWYTAFSLLVFVLAEGLYFGFGFWWFTYLYLWWIPVLAAIALCRFRNPILFAVVAALFGFCYGALGALPNLILFGAESAFAYVINGLPFDILHGVGNFVLTAVAFCPCRLALEKISAIGQKSRSVKN